MIKHYSVSSSNYEFQVKDWKSRSHSLSWGDDFNSLGINLRGKIILDCGCGPGRYFHFLKGNGGYVFGLDQEIDCLLEIKKRNRLYDGIVLGSIHDLPIKSKTFDVILLRYVIHHIHPNDLVVAFSNLKTLLKNDGVLVVETAYHTQFEKHFDHQIFPELSCVAKAIYPDRDDLINSLNIAGLKVIIERETVQEFVPYTSVQEALKKSHNLVDSGQGPTIWLRLDEDSRKKFHDLRKEKLPLIFQNGPVPRIWHGTFIVSKSKCHSK